MKIKILISVFIIVFFNSCQNVLDVEPYGRTTLDDMFEEENTVGAYLSSCYEDFPKFGYGYNQRQNYPISMCGDAYFAGHSISFAYDGTWTTAWPNNCPVYRRGAGGQNDFQNQSMWDVYWRNIRRCNVFLSRISTATVTSESLRNRWTAEAKVLRAFYYMQLIPVFGAMPISKEPYGLDFDTSTLTKASFKECVDFIVNDCDEAIECSDLPWRIETESEAFRLTRGVAAAIKSRAILFAASPLYNDGNNYWAEAERITLEALNQCLDNGYELYTVLRNPATFKSAYHEHFCTWTDYSSDPIDKESILVSSQTGVFWVVNWGVPLQSANQSGPCPSQELVDSYCMQSTGLPVLDLEHPYKDETTHLIPNYYPNSGYDPANPYVGRDPRFYATVYYNGSKRKNTRGVLTTLDIYNGGNCGIINTTEKRTSTGYYSRKYDHPDAEKAFISKIKISFPIFRLAELYLNYAEAAVENGHIAEAVQMVKVIRDRVNMPNINPADQNEARLMVRNERRVEMAYEENRYYDIRRWTEPDGDLSKYCSNVTCMWIEKNGTDFEYHRGIAGDDYNKETDSWAGTGRHWQCYTNKYLFWPLIDEEANRLTTATGVNWQSPGW